MSQLKLVSNRSLSQVDRDRRLFEYMVLAGYALIAQIATSLYFRVELQYPPARLYQLAEFTAMRPYQFRVLIPALVHVAARLLHANRFQYLPLYQFAEFGATLSALLLFRVLLAEFVPRPRASLVAPLLIAPMLMIHVSCAENLFPSDTPSIAFFIAALILIRREKWPWLYLVLAVATVNRESSALIVTAFALAMLRRMPFSRYAAHLAAMTALWTAIKLCLDRLFAGNPGGLTEDHVIYNRYLFSALLHGQPYVLSTALMLCAIPAVLYVGRRLVPPFLMRLLAIAPFYAAIMWQVGIFDEVRAWNEVIVILAAPLLVLMSRLADRLAGADSEAESEPVAGRQELAA